jgi:multiple antibiotic resistance protein
MIDTYLLILAALFPIVNPPGSAIVFLSLTKRASPAARARLARTVAIYSFFVMVGSFLVGASILRLYGISVPVLRTAGGLVVATSGWTLLNSGSSKLADAHVVDSDASHQANAFYPLTLPLTTGPGTIAVMISLSLSRAAYAGHDLHFWAGALFAVMTIAVSIYVFFVFSNRIATLLGNAGVDIAVRLSAFILFCLGVQIVWTGITELIQSVR